MFLRLLIFTLFLTVMNTFAQTPPIETGVSQTLAKWRAARYSDVRYKLNITLEKGAPTLKGTIEIRVKLSEPPALAGGANAPLVVLDWRKIRGKEDLSTVSNVSLNNKSLTLAANPPANAGGSDTSAKFEEINEHLVFKDGVIKGENVIKLDFTSPILTSGGAITRYVDKEDGAEYVYSLFVPSDASTAFPVFDQPDLKARFNLSIKTFGKVISNAEPKKIQNLPVSHSEDWKKGLSVTDFEETEPISTYVFAFAVGDFAEFEERFINGTIRERIYVRKSQAEKFKPHAAEVARLNHEAIKYLAGYFDYKFPFPKYDLVLIPEFPFGGMEHAGATFLREDRVIFPTEPTKNDYITRANLIFHEAAHQWFGDTVTMKWFDDLWLKEGFAEFMAYKTLEKVMPEYNAWKIFYERNKQAAYLTDSTKGTTPIYQEIPNLSAAKSAYGNIVYRKAPSFLKQAEFYLGEKEFQTAVRAFLKKHQFANAEWTDLVKEFETYGGFDKGDLRDWAEKWVKNPGLPIVRFGENKDGSSICDSIHWKRFCSYFQFNGSWLNVLDFKSKWIMNTKILVIHNNGERDIVDSRLTKRKPYDELEAYPGTLMIPVSWDVEFKFLNYEDYGYGIFLLDAKSRDYVLANIQTEKDDFLRTMMWGALWDSVRETELAPKDYVELVIKNINLETDESTIQTLLGRVSTAMNYYIKSEPSALADGSTADNRTPKSKVNPPANAGGSDLAVKIETLLIDKMQNAPTLGQRITFYRAFLNIASSEKARTILKDVLNGKTQIKDLKLKTKDRFDIITKLLILADQDAPNLLAELEKTETSDEAKRYAYAAKAGIGTAENKANFWNDFTNNKELSESYIESAFIAFNSTKHADLTLIYLEKSLAELPNLKRNRKIFFVNGWLSAFIGGQKSEQALTIVNKFLADNPNLDRDLRLKILESSDGLERSVKIRGKFSPTEQTAPKD